MAFRLEGLSPPAPMLLSTSLSTAPPAPTTLENAKKLRQGVGVKNRTSRGMDNSRGVVAAQRA